MRLPRLVPEIPLPPYTYVPGGPFPHPNQPGGHNYGKPAPVAALLDPARWWECKEYLYGFDLFNGPAPSAEGKERPPGVGELCVGYYWEAHEAWESLWHACGRAGQPADFLKGLIKLAAAGVKVRQGQPEGVRNHARRAAALFEQALHSMEGSGRYLGMDLPTLIRGAHALAERPQCQPEHGDSVFDWTLRPTMTVS